MHPIRPLLPRSHFFLRINLPHRYHSHVSSLRYVKVKRPWFRRFFTTCLVYGAAFYTWSTFVQLPYDDALHGSGPPPDSSPVRRTRGNSGADGIKQPVHETRHITDSKTLFIPLGWPRLQEGNFYAASDPEWREYIKISGDHKKLQALKDELASIVLREASGSSPLSRILGPPFVITQYWLAHHIPTRAPSVYYRSGLEFTEEGVSWVSKPMSSKGGETLHKCLRPHLVALAVKDAYAVFWRSFLSKFNTNSSDDELVLRLLNSSSKTQLSPDLETMGDLLRSDSQVWPSTSPQISTSQDDGDTSLHPPAILSILQRLPFPNFGPGSDIYAARLAFKQRLVKCWSHERGPRRRGTFFISGPVGLRGSMGFCRFEVEGEYDPVTAKWISVSFFLRDLTRFRQKALGGN